MSTAYATTQDMTDRFGETELVQLTDRAGTGAIDTTVLQGALDDACDEVDAYVGSRYVLPPTSIPAVLTRVACDIARYRLYDDQAPQEIRNRYQDAVAMLKQIASGALSLGMDTGTPAATADKPQVNAPERTLTSDSLAGFMPGLDEY